MNYLARHVGDKTCTALKCLCELCPELCPELAEGLAEGMTAYSFAHPIGRHSSESWNPWADSKIPVRCLGRSRYSGLDSSFRWNDVREITFSFSLQPLA